MASFPGRAAMMVVERAKREVGKKVGENVSGLCTNVQQLRSRTSSAISSATAEKKLDSTVRKIGKSISSIGKTVEIIRSTGAASISNAVSAVVEECHNLCRNVERNVQTLTSKCDAMTDIPSSYVSPPTQNSTSSSLPSSRDAGFKDEVGELALSNSSMAPGPLPSSSSTDEEVSEVDRHDDHSSVSATSAFSIGFVGPPLFVETGTELVASQLYDSPPKTQQSLSGPSLRLEEVRRAIGELLIVYKHICSLGLPESSWVNKMPWHNPPPTRLARGLHWPRQKFSSTRERHEYHRRMRRRGSYWIKAPLPGWTWFAADVIFLYFLIYNPARLFAI